MIWKTTGFIAFGLMFSTASLAQTITPELVKHIERAGTEIGLVQKARGSDGAFAVITECYKRELASAKSWTPGLQTCMAQDIIVSKTTAALYASFSADIRQKAKIESPEDVTKPMAQRVYGVLTRFNVPMDKARAFNDAVGKQGTEAYGRAMFPDKFPKK